MLYIYGTYFYIFQNYDYVKIKEVLSLLFPPSPFCVPFLPFLQREAHAEADGETAESCRPAAAQVCMQLHTRQAAVFAGSWLAPGPQSSAVPPHKRCAGPAPSSVERSPPLGPPKRTRMHSSTAERENFATGSVRKNEGNVNNTQETPNFLLSK